MIYLTLVHERSLETPHVTGNPVNDIGSESWAMSTIEKKIILLLSVHEFMYTGNHFRIDHNLIKHEVLSQSRFNTGPTSAMLHQK